MANETLDADIHVTALWRWSDYVAARDRAAVGVSEFVVEDIQPRVCRRALGSRPEFDRAVAPVGCSSVQSPGSTDGWSDADDATCRALFVDSVRFLSQFTQLAGE